MAELDFFGAFPHTLWPSPWLPITASIFFIAAFCDLASQNTAIKKIHTCHGSPKYKYIYIYRYTTFFNHTDHIVRRTTFTHYIYIYTIGVLVLLFDGYATLRNIVKLLYIYIYLGVRKACKSIISLLFVGNSNKRQTDNRPMLRLTQGEGHNVWGNAPKKSNSATCAHFSKIARCTSKSNVFLIFKNFRGVKIVIFHDFC